MREVNHDALEVVHPERAHLTRCVLSVGRLVRRSLRIEHRVVDDELRTPFEDLLESLGSAGAIEDVLLRYALPRKVAAPSAEFIAQPIEFLLLRQERLALCDPLFV